MPRACECCAAGDFGGERRRTVRGGGAAVPYTWDEEGAEGGCEVEGAGGEIITPQHIIEFTT